MNNILQLIRERFGGSDEETGMTEALSNMVQITMAALMIFIMISVLFIAKSRAEVEELKGKLPYYVNSLEQIRNTEPGMAHTEREQALIEVQRQKLLRALDALESETRTKLALSVFARSNNDGSIDYAVDGVLVGDKVSDRHFIEGCKFASQNLPYHDRICQDWLTCVLLRSEMTLRDSPGNIIVGQTPQIVEEGNESWLKEEIRKRIDGLYKDTCSLQRAVLARLQSFYRSNQEALKGTEVYGLVTSYFSAKPEERSSMVSRISSELYRQAKSVFEQQGVPLLSGV